MSTGRGRRLATLLLCTLGWACSGDGSGGTGQDDAAGKSAAGYCAEYFRCGCDGVDMQYADEAACVADLEAQIQAVLDDGEARGLTFDPDCVDQGIAALESFDCAGYSSFTLSEIHAMSSGCYLFHGDAQKLEPCEELPLGGGSECVEGLECSSGMCFDAFEVVGEGASCTTAYCDTGLACINDTCATAPAEGEACATGSGSVQNQCALGLHCEDATSTCQPLAAAGQPCEPSGCVPGYICPAGTCEEQWPAVCG